MNTIRNYGFKLNEVEDLKAYKLGAIELPKKVLVESGQWDSWLPVDELQTTPHYDTYGCTVYGTENIFQTLERFHFQQTKEYDERYNYNLVKISPPGADPHDVAESFRNDGVISDTFPITSTYEEYCKPRPMPTKYVDLGVAHPRELRHQWLWTNSPDKPRRTDLIKEYLKYGPLGVSVTAWSESGGVYVDNGQRNTHWTMLYGWNDKGWKIYDSYAPHRKILSFDHNIEACKRYIMLPSTRQAQLNIFALILQKLQEWFNIVKAPTIEPVVAVEPILTQPEPPKPSLLVSWAKAIEIYEGANKSWHNPGAIRSASGGFLKFKTYQEGFDYLLDYLRRAGTGKHPSYRKGGMTTLIEFQRIYSPASDNNNPEKYCDFICSQLGTTRNTLLVDML